MEIKKKDEKKKVRVQSVDRIFDMVEELANEKHGLTISEIAKRLNLQVSTCYNLIHTLKTRDYVQQDPITKKYCLGFKFMHLKNTFIDNLELRSIAIPFLEQLHKEIPETIHLSIREGMNVIQAFRLESKHSIRVDSAYVGNRGPIFCTATGRAFLLNYEENELDEMLAELDLEPYTDHTITDLAKLKEEILKSKERGYTQDFMEYQNSVFCIGAPIYNYNNEIGASMSVSVPSIRFSGQEKERISKLVLQTSREISRILGAAI